MESSPRHQYLATILQKPINEITLDQIVRYHEIVSILSSIATLYDNGQKGGARFLMEFHWFDPEDPMFLGALNELAHQGIARVLHQMAVRLDQE